MISKGSKEQVWDRRDRETDKAWRAFRIYLAMGPTRSHPEVVDKLGRRENYRVTIARWSKRNRWQERACAWDLQAVERAISDTEALRATVQAKRIRQRLAVQSEALEISTDAVKALAQIIRNPLASAIARVQAAEAVFRHAGILPPEDEKEDTSSIDDAHLITWLASLFARLPDREQRLQFKSLAMQALADEASIH